MVQEKGEVGILFFFGVGISWGQPWSFQTLGGSFSVPKLGSEKFFYPHFSLVFNKGVFWMEFSTTSGRTWWGLYWLQHCCQWHMPHSHRVRCQGKVFQRWLCISHFFRRNLEMKLGTSFLQLGFLVCRPTMVPTFACQQDNCFGQLILQPFLRVSTSITRWQVMWFIQRPLK